MRTIHIESLHDDNIRRFIVPLVKTGRLKISVGTPRYWNKLELCDMYLLPEVLYYGIQYLDIVTIVEKFIDYCKHVTLVGFEPSKEQQIEEYKKIFGDKSGWDMANLNPELIFQIFTDEIEVILQLIGRNGLIMSNYDTTYIKFSRCISDKELVILQRRSSRASGFELQQSYIKSIRENSSAESYSQRIERVWATDSKCSLCINSLGRGPYNVGNIVLKNANVTLEEQQTSPLAVYLERTIDFLGHMTKYLPPTAIISSSSTSITPYISTFSNKDLSICGHIYPNPSVSDQQVIEGFKTYKDIETVEVLVKKEHLEAFLDSLEGAKVNLHLTDNKDSVVSLYPNNQKKILNSNDITEEIPTVQMEDCCLKYSHFDLNIDLRHKSAPDTCPVVQIPFTAPESIKVRTFEPPNDIIDPDSLQDSLAFKIVRKIIETCDWENRGNFLKYYSTASYTPGFVPKSFAEEYKINEKEMTILDNLVNFLKSTTFTYFITT